MGNTSSKTVSFNYNDKKVNVEIWLKQVAKKGGKTMTRAFCKIVK